MILALEKENLKEGKGRLKRRCSACSIGQRCINTEKLKSLEKKGLPEYDRPPVSPPQEEDRGSDLGDPPDSPVSSRTRSRKRTGSDAGEKQAII